MQPPPQTRAFIIPVIYSLSNVSASLRMLKFTVTKKNNSV
jgi:hypothetical protein